MSNSPLPPADAPDVETSSLDRVYRALGTAAQCLTSPDGLDAAPRDPLTLAIVRTIRRAPASRPGWYERFLGPCRRGFPRPHRQHGRSPTLLRRRTPASIPWRP